MHRARERVRGERKRFEATESAKAELLQTLHDRDRGERRSRRCCSCLRRMPRGPRMAAARPPPALNPIVGADRIARLVLGLREKFWSHDRTMKIATINGETGLCIRDGDRLIAVMSIATDGERIHAVYAVVNPDKLH